MSAIEKIIDRLASEEYPDEKVMLRLHNMVEEARGELAALRAENEELHNLLSRLGDLLTGTANAIKGKPPQLTWHDWSDLPMRAAKLKARVESAERLATIREKAPCCQAVYSCHAWHEATANALADFRRTA